MNFVDSVVGSFKKYIYIYIYIYIQFHILSVQCLTFYPFLFMSSIPWRSEDLTTNQLMHVKSPLCLRKQEPLWITVLLPSSHGGGRWQQHTQLQRQPIVNPGQATTEPGRWERPWSPEGLRKTCRFFYQSSIISGFNTASSILQVDT